MRATKIYLTLEDDDDVDDEEKKQIKLQTKSKPK
jgi:hypothetical protein